MKTITASSVEQVEHDSSSLDKKYTIIRSTDPADSIKMIPWFTMTYQSREDSYIEVRERMTYDPDHTCLCLILDGEEVKGIGLTYGRKEDAFIWEAHADQSVPRSVVDEALELMMDWARSMGYEKIFGKPNRAPKIWVRRWGFKISDDDITEVYKEL